MSEPTLKPSRPRDRRADPQGRRSASTTRCGSSPSENYASRAVLEATRLGAHQQVLRGLRRQALLRGPAVHRRQVETLAIERLKTLFGVEHVNVQPYSGTPANLAVYFAFCKPGDTIMGLACRRRPPHARLERVDHRQVLQGACSTACARTITASTSTRSRGSRASTSRSCSGAAPPRTRASSTTRRSRDRREVGAILVADIAHIAGLVAGGAHPSPVGIADVVTTHHAQDASAVRAAA